jgi:LysM repeat protein
MSSPRSKTRSRREQDSDSMEALKPLVVLVLFGTILYGAYSVVQKGPATESTPATAAGDAPPFAAAPTGPQVELTPAAPEAQPTPLDPPPAQPASQTPALTPGLATTVTPTPPPPAAGAAQASPATVPAPLAAATPAVTSPPATLDAATVAAAAAATAPTYLNAVAAPPPLPDQPPPPPLADQPPPAAAPSAATARPERYATLATAPPPLTPPSDPAPPEARPGAASSAAFAAAWEDAHGKLSAGRYAEALGALSVWYDDPSLGLEESQRLEDLLGQLAGTVIYSQQDLLLPPHVAAAGETLPAIAAPLGVTPELLAKINGVPDPNQLIPGEHLKVIRGPFDAVVSISRRRLSLQLNGNFAGSFPVVVGRQFLTRVGGSLPVTDVQRGGQGDVALTATGANQNRRMIALGEGMTIEAVDDPTVANDNTPPASLVVSVRDLGELIDILGPGSRVLVRQ